MLMYFIKDSIWQVSAKRKATTVDIPDPTTVIVTALLIVVAPKVVFKFSSVLVFSGGEMLNYLGLLVCLFYFILF